MPSSSASSSSKVVRGHVVACAAVHNDGFLRAKPFRRAGDVNSRVTAATNHDAPPKQRFVLTVHGAKHLDRVEDLCRGAGRDVGPLADMRADSEKGRIEAAFGHGALNILDLRAIFEAHAEIKDALHFGVQHFTRQPVFWDAEPHHAAR